MQRNYGFDNIKCILIFCVVLGHLLELCSGFGVMYRMIYLFHMPVFMFITGYFAKPGWKSIANKAWMYILFQVLYILFEGYVLRYNKTLDFCTPYWILWYMFVTVFYTALIPLYHAKTGKKRIVILSVAVVLSVAAGFVREIGYTWSLSRFLVFQPYFLLGFYAREQKLPSVGKRTFVGLLIGAALSLGTACLPFVTTGLLYGSINYRNPGESLSRLMLIAVSCIWIGTFWGLKDRMKNKIPIVSAVGKHTLSVYLLHGFVARLGAWKVLPMPQNILMVIMITVVLCSGLGNPAMGTFVTHLSPLAWIKKKEL